jgi:hypothetical protein
MTDERTAIEIPFKLQPGEIWFYLELALIEDVPALYQQLSTMNIKPQLAYMKTLQGIEILLLLAHEKREELLTAPDDYYFEEQKRLADTINCEAMHCRFRRTHAVSAIAA